MVKPSCARDKPGKVILSFFYPDGFICMLSGEKDVDEEADEKEPVDNQHADQIRDEEEMQASGPGLRVETTSPWAPSALQISQKTGQPASGQCLRSFWILRFAMREMKG